MKPTIIAIAPKITTLSVVVTARHTVILVKLSAKE
jgi:hypothetical protein